MKSLSHIVGNTPASGIRRFFDLVAELAKLVEHRVLIGVDDADPEGVVDNCLVGAGLVPESSAT